MTLQIIGGLYRGRKLSAPKSPHTRPTTSMLRKAVFDILREKVENAEFLDLFAGSGAMGIEALSRGAAHATFIDSNPVAVKCIHENVSSLGVASQATIKKGEAFPLLQALKKREKTFDLIYVDPPYGKFSLSEFLYSLDKLMLLASGGILFVEEPTPSKEKLAELSFVHLKHYDTRRFGKTVLHQFKNA